MIEQSYQITYTVTITGTDDGTGDLIEQGDRQLINLIGELSRYLETGDNAANRVLGQIFTPSYLNGELI